MNSDSRQRFEELAAGLVLGNLDVEELQELQQALATQHITSADLMASIQVVAQLQADGDRQEIAPPVRLRFKILEAATREGHPLQEGDRPRQSWRPAFWQLALGGCVVAGAIGLAIDNTSLRQQLAQASQQQAFWERVATQASTTQTNDREIVETPPSPSLPLALVATTEQVFDDHLAALDRDRGPADFLSDRLDAVWEHFRSAGVLSSPPPSLTVTEADLIGGSPCWFKAAQGVRFSYALQEEKTVSLYQLSPSAAADLKGKTGPVYVNSADGTNMMLWSEESVLYAIVGNLPLPELQRLADASI